jgi:hypothetical protein
MPKSTSKQPSNPEDRRPNGQFGVGNSLSKGHGRPPALIELNEVQQASEIRQYVREGLVSKGLVDRALAMAAGEKPFHRLGPKALHAMFIDLWDRSIGKPAAVNVSAIVSAAERDGVVFVKRVIGVLDSDV